METIVRWTNRLGMIGSSRTAPPPPPVTRRPDPTSQRGIRNAGLAAVVGAGLAIAGNTLVLAATPHAAKDTVSYPLSPSSFRAGQVFFAVTQLLMAWGVVGLARSGIGGRGRAARTGAWLAVAGFVLTVPGELALGLVADAATDSARANAVSSVYGIGVVLADIGLIVLGVAALRARLWPRAGASLVLALGLFQLFVVTPVVVGAGFASVGAFVVITLQDVMVALLGFRLVGSADVSVRLTREGPSR